MAAMPPIPKLDFQNTFATGGTSIDSGASVGAPPTMQLGGFTLPSWLPWAGVVLLLGLGAWWAFKD